MRGYCQDCGQTVRMLDVETIQIPNLTYRHQGRCSTPGCGGRIWKTIADRDILMTPAGHKIPRFVFVGKSTPGKITMIRANQRVIERDGRVWRAESKYKSETLSEVKKRIKSRRKK